MDKKVRWGILSTAGIARKQMVGAINNSKSGIVAAVASRSLEKAQRFGEELGIKKCYGSYEELIADPDIDAIYIPLPNGLHEQWSIKCAEAGKPVLCEKPLGCNFDETKRVIDTFKSRNILFGVNYMYRFHPVTQKVRDLIRAGDIGNIVNIRTSFFAQIPETDVRWQDNFGGGALLDLGCYCVDIMRFMTDENPIEAKAVGVFKSESVDLSISGVLQFPSGVQGYFGCGMTSSFDCSYEIVGTSGRIEVNRGGMVVWPGEDFVVKVIKSDSSENIVIPSADHYILCADDFNDALINEKSVTYAPEDSLVTMRILDALRKSASSLSYEDTYMSSV